MKTADPAITDTSVGLEPDPSIGTLARDVWRDLLASSKRKTLLANSLGCALGACWDVSWRDGRLIVQRQQVAPAGSALSLSTSSRPALGSPKVVCDGQRIFADHEPEDDDLKNDLAYVMAKIAKYLNWPLVVCTAARFLRIGFSITPFTNATFISGLSKRRGFSETNGRPIPIGTA